MHKTFYASGFLYHSPTQQILLQQPTSDSSNLLTLFTGKSKRGETQIETFQRAIVEILNVKLPLSAIHPIYDYPHAETKEQQYILYADVPTKVYEKKMENTSWHQFKQLSKLKLAPLTKQDIIVGQRVINAAERERMEQADRAEEQQTA